jgi:1-phosphofructokinase family hexose kinase
MIYTVTLNPALDRELVVPEIRFAEVLHTSALKLDYGGKGFNVSRALSALGTQNVAVGFLGGGPGLRITMGLEELGIVVESVDIHAETRTNVSIIDEKQSRYVKVNVPGPVVTRQEQEKMLEKVSDLVQPGDWWVLAGSLPRGVPDTFYNDLILAVQSEDGQAVLNAQGPEMKHGCQALPFLAKIDNDQAEALTGHESPTPEDALPVVKTLHEMGAKHVFMTFEHSQGVLSNNKQVWSASAPDVDVHNPVGARDAALAGLLWSLLNDESWPDALRWAVAAGAVSATLEGTAAASRDKVTSLMKSVDVILLGEL